MKVDPNIIHRKFLSLSKYLTIIDRLVSLPSNEIDESIELQLQAERLFEIIAQAMVDICTHIVARISDKVPKTYTDCMHDLGKLGVISPKFASKIAKTAKMRNFVVHRYEIINHVFLVEALSEIKKDLETFKIAIFEWLEKNK